MQEFQDSFEELLNRVELPESYAISCFLSGLKEEIQLAVRMFMPKTLSHTYCLAKLEELKIQAAKKNRPSVKPMGNPSSPSQKWNTSQAVPLLTHPGKPTEGIQKRPPRILSAAEMDEKRAKGLCYWCNDKYEFGHKCAKRQLYRIEFVDDDEVIPAVDNEPHEGDISQAEEEPLAHISLHAMTTAAVPQYRTMRITGHAGKRPIKILVYGGSSHNFIHPALVQALGLKTINVDPMKVIVANGGTLQTTSICPQFTWKMQGHTFLTDMLLLPIGGCEVVLGIQWLSTLGDILCNFNSLRMEFQYEGKKKWYCGGLTHPLCRSWGRKKCRLLYNIQKNYQQHICAL